jgi:hypothetical protein
VLASRWVIAKQKAGGQTQQATLHVRHKNHGGFKAQRASDGNELSPWRVLIVQAPVGTMMCDMFKLRALAGTMMGRDRRRWHDGGACCCLSPVATLHLYSHVSRKREWLTRSCWGGWAWNCWGRSVYWRQSEWIIDTLEWVHWGMVRMAPHHQPSLFWHETWIYWNDQKYVGTSTKSPQILFWLFSLSSL